MELGSYTLLTVRHNYYEHYHSTDGINYECFEKVIINDSMSSLNPALTFKEQEEAE
jgi:hypothetical protein